MTSSAAEAAIATLELAQTEPAPRLSVEEITDAAQAAIESLETVEETPKRRADTRAPTEPRMRLVRGTSPNDSLERRETAERSSAPSFQPSQSSWLGIVTAQPQVGARVVIGTWMSSEFTVTSPVEKIVERHDGIIVQTTSKNRYFVSYRGDAFLVRRFG